MRKIPLFRIFLFFTLFSLSSCYQVQTPKSCLYFPKEALETAYDQVDKTLFETTLAPFQDWWAIFQDAQLNCLMESALQVNPTLQIAETKILAAHFAKEQARSPLFPSINWEGDLQKVKLSKTGVFPASIDTASPTGLTGPVATGIPFYYTQWESSLSLFYQLDVWGKNKKQFLAYLGEEKSQIADYHFSKLLLSFAIAKTYFELQVNYQKKIIQEEIKKNRDQYLQLISLKLNHHLADGILEKQAQHLFSQSTQNLLQTNNEIAIYTHQLMTFLAQDFNQVFDPIPLEKKELPKLPLPQKLPLHLLAFRPDIQSQLWLIDALGYRVEAAKADFYPDINLMAFAGFQTLDLKKFFWWSSGYGDGQLAATLPLFDAGLRQTRLNQSSAALDLAILCYNDLVLNAAKETLDALSLFKTAYRLLEELSQELKRQEEQMHLVALKRDHHLISNFEFLDSQQKFLTVKEKWIEAKGQTILAILQLILALGGINDGRDNPFRTN